MERERKGMGHRHHHHHHHHENNEAVEGLMNLFRKANHDLLLVQHKLEEEFRQIYPDNAHPMKLVSRIKKIQEELPSLKDQCRELLSVKQDLIDKARRILVGNRSLVQRMQASMGIPLTSDSDDPEFATINQIIDEWKAQVTTRIGDQADESESVDVNELLFSALV